MALFLSHGGWLAKLFTNFMHNILFLVTLYTALMMLMMMMTTVALNKRPHFTLQCFHGSLQPSGLKLARNSKESFCLDFREIGIIIIVLCCLDMYIDSK